MIDKPFHSLIPCLYTGRNCELKAEIHPEIRDNSINICRLISAPLAVNRCATLWIRHTCAFISRYRSLMKDVNRNFLLLFSASTVQFFWGFFLPLGTNDQLKGLHCSYCKTWYINSFISIFFDNQETFTWTLGCVFFVLPTYPSQP